MGKRKSDNILFKLKNDNNYLRHLTDLMQVHLSQFVYTGLPDTLPSEWLELFLAVNGSIAVGYVKELDNKDIYCATGCYNGDYNGYLPSEYTACVTGLGEISGKWYGSDSTIVVGKNNLQGAPEFDIPFTAEVLSQVDISESVNVIFTRLSRLPYVDNDIQKAAIETAIKSIIEGNIYAVANRNIKSQFAEYIESGSTDKDRDKFLDLVDPERIDGLQYLNQYRDNVVKRFLSRRGYMMHTTAKLAQQTNAELHGSDSYALLYPLEQLRCRKDMCDKINKLFGFNISVEFNEVLRKVYKDYFAEPDTQAQDNTGDREELTDNDTDSTDSGDSGKSDDSNDGV